VFLFGTMIAMGGHFAVQHYSESRAQTDFERPGKEVVIFLNETMDRHVAMLETAQRRFTTKKAVPNRWKFFQSTRNTLKDLPGIQALEWIPRVRTKYRARYEKRAVKDGLFGFSFFGPDGKKYRAKDREHFPIYYVEPYPGNESTLGFDLATDPAALDALRTARDTGKPVTTRLTAIDTGQKPGAGDNAARDAPGIVVVLPVYNTEIPPFTVKERRRRIRGFIRGVVRLDRMVQAYRSNLSVPPGLEVAFYSHSKDGKPNLRYHNPPLPAKTKALPFPKAGKTDDINLSAGFRIVDQDWTMVLRPESRLFLRNLSSAAWGFAIFALLTTAILLLYLITSQTRTRAIERSVTERTAALESEITQRKQIEIELRAAKDEAVDANHAKSEFLAIMSHELRTPLNAISGFSEVMTNEVYGTLGHKNYGDYASFIYDSADHLHSLINDILDLSKIEAARYEIHKEIIDVAEAWRPVEEMMVEKIAAAKISLTNRLSETPACIRADDRALRQVFLNLLSNAVKFTPEGGQIEITSKFDDTGRFIISVQDTGIGISKEDLALVFEPFKQVESKVARKHKGTGLGLPLTQRLVALHGGQVKIESVLGHGTTVHIVLEPSAVVYDSGEPPETPDATDKNGNQEEFKYAAG
jgi:signal transduction histidine kinase